MLMEYAFAKPVADQENAGEGQELNHPTQK